jgi:hypothetical protein
VKTFAVDMVEDRLQGKLKKIHPIVRGKRPKENLKD